MPQKTDRPPHTNVSLQGDRTYVKALKALAYDRGMTMGELIRSAIDRVYGEDMKPRLAFFKAERGYKNSHPVTSGTENEH